MDTGSSAYVTPSLAQIISAVSEGVPSPNFRQPHVTHFFHCTLSSGHPERSRKKLVAPPLPQRDRLRAVNGFQGGGWWPKVRQVSPCPMEATGREGSSFTEGPGKECLQSRRPGFDPWVRKIPWRRAWQLTPVFLPGESLGQRRLARLQSMGLQRVQPRLSNFHFNSPFTHLR